MLKLKKIAVTGGLATGKTTVCQLFKELGAYVVSADEIVHQLLSPSTSVGQQVIHLLGPEIIRDEKFDRKKIAQLVFSDPSLLCALEKELHPAVFTEIEKRYNQASKEKKYPLFFAEIPLLYEVGKEEQFDSVISVEAKKNLALERFRKQKNESKQEFEKRMERQLPTGHKAAKADFVIENNGDLEDLRAKVKTLYRELNEPRRHDARYS